MESLTHYRFMDKNHRMTEKTHFRTLSKTGQKAIIDFWNPELLSTSNKNNLAILAIIYGTRHIWIEVEELKLLLKEKTPKLTKKLIEEAFDEFFKRAKPSQERKIVMWTGCKTQGMIRLSSEDLSLPICNDSTCPTCSLISEALKEEVNKQIKKEK